MGELLKGRVLPQPSGHKSELAGQKPRAALHCAGLRPPCRCRDRCMLAEMVPGQFRRSKGDGGVERFGDATAARLYHEGAALIVDLSEAREIAI